MYIVTIIFGSIYSAPVSKLSTCLAVTSFGNWRIYKASPRWGKYYLVGRCATYTGV